MEIKILTERRCHIGEGPIWNASERRLYFTNGGGNEICTYDPKSASLGVRKLPFSVAAFVFDRAGRIIVSHSGGVHALGEDGSLSPIYDEGRYRITAANDMKAGPDGAIYVGTQSSRRLGISDQLDGRLYRISPNGEVTVLLDGLILSNGMDWSLDETKLYHTDSDTGMIREYDFCGGKIAFTGREVHLPGVDGFTVGKNGMLYVTRWGHWCISLVDTASMRELDRIPLPVRAPASCGFFGEEMDTLAVTTASYHSDPKKDPNAGFTLLMKPDTAGRAPYLFG